MTSAAPDDQFAALRELAGTFEQMADYLEHKMPTVRALRNALSDLAPGAARFAEFDGSVDQFDHAAAEGVGLGRIEAARQRMLASLREPMDEVPRPS